MRTSVNIFLWFRTVLPIISLLEVPLFMNVSSFQPQTISLKQCTFSTMTCPPSHSTVSSSASALMFSRNWILSLFEDTSLEKKRRQLKQDLLQICMTVDDLDFKTKRQQIESTMAELALVRPLDSTASSPLLRKSWNL